MLYYNNYPYGYGTPSGHYPWMCYPEYISIRNNRQNLELINVLAVKERWNGSGVKIAVIDTGYYGKNENRLKKKKNTVDNSTDISQNSTHGTAVIDIILDVAPQASIYAYKVYDDEDIAKENQQIIIRQENELELKEEIFLSALDDAETEQVDLVNLSLSNWFFKYDPEEDPIMKRVDELVKRGIIVVCTVGNKGCDECVGSPGNSPKVITVGATTLEGATVAPFSSRGPVSNTREIKPDVVAPGIYINPYSGIEEAGTSYAVPYVSGSIALLKQKNPEWGPSQMKSALSTTATQLLVGEEIIISPLAQGSGLINVQQAITQHILLSPVHVSFVLSDTSSVEKKVRLENFSDQIQTYNLIFVWDNRLQEASNFRVVHPDKIQVQPKESIEIVIQTQLNPVGFPKPGELIQSTGTMYLVNQDDQGVHVPFYIEMETLAIIQLINFEFIKKQLDFMVNYDDVSLVTQIGKRQEQGLVLLTEVRNKLPKGRQTVRVSNFVSSVIQKFVGKDPRQLISNQQFIVQLFAVIEGTKWKQNISVFTFGFHSGQVELHSVDFLTVPQIGY